MGDRGQVRFKDLGIWFYTHWNGYRLHINLQASIEEAKDRWDDKAYCARIIIGSLCAEYNGESTGAGILNNSIESEHPECVLDIENNTVFYAGFLYSFTQFIQKDFGQVER